MGFFADKGADAYERALTQAETNPAQLDREQKDLLKKLQNEPGPRGNRARRAMK